MDTERNKELEWYKAVVAQLPESVWQEAVDAFTRKANEEIAEAMQRAADADPDNEFLRMHASALNHA